MSDERAPLKTVSLGEEENSYVVIVYIRKDGKVTAEKNYYPKTDAGYDAAVALFNKS